MNYKTRSRSTTNNIITMQSLLQECSNLSTDIKQVNKDLFSMQFSLKDRLQGIGRRVRTQEATQCQDRWRIENQVLLHNYLSRQIFKSADEPMERPNTEAIKYRIKETTLFDRNPSLYLKKQLQTSKIKNNKLLHVSRQFGIQQQKFVEKLSIYSEFIINK